MYEGIYLSIIPFYLSIILNLEKFNNSESSFLFNNFALNEQNISIILLFMTISALILRILVLAISEFLPAF